MKKNWLTLNGDTFLWIKNGKGLLYNTTNFQILCFENTRKINSICQKLLVTDSLYSASISDKVFKDAEVQNWINSIIICQMGVFTPKENADHHPVSLKPILKIQDNVERYKWERSRDIQGSIINNLHEVTFYLNGSDNGEKHFYKQTLYPIITAKHIPYLDVIEFYRNIKNPFLTNINLVGALHKYENFDKLVANIVEMDIALTVHVTVEDFTQSQKLYQNLLRQDNISLKLLIKNVGDAHKSVFEDMHNLYYVFLIVSEKDYDTALSLIEEYKIKDNSQIIPLYKNNLEFFEEALFMHNEDFETLKLSKRDIFVRQSLNINNFGKLTILPSGNVYSNVNYPKIGKMEEASADLIYKELTSGKSWLNIRKKKPCNRCVYQWLCPSPSNYEIAIRRNNLCNITQ